MTNESQFIEHDGKWWRKVARKAERGEIALITQDTSNHAYANGDVVRILYVLQNEGIARFARYVFAQRVRDGKDRAVFDRDYHVLEPLGIVNEIHVHEGAAYRKVARKAQVGELVLISDTHPYESHRNKIKSVTRLEPGRSGWIGFGDGGAQYGYYVVLEPLTDEKAFASLTDLSPEITLSEVFEMFVRGKKAAAQESFEGEELRYKRDSRRLRESLANEDIGAADGYWTLMRSHHEKMTYWRKEIEKWDGEIERCKNR